jgi:hypothetical protein
MNLSVLVHTFDGYQHLWKGCVQSWQKTIAAESCDFYFGTDIEFVPGFIDGFMVIYSGRGEWSDRLRKLIEQIPTDYIFYFQEDHWLTGHGPIFSDLVRMMDEKQLLRLQVSPVNQFYSLTGSELPIFFHKSSKYLVSHQPSIWRKDFLLSCLEPGENPWVNEYEGTKRLQKREISGKIAIYPYDWYSHKCIKGQVQD